MTGTSMLRQFSPQFSTNEAVTADQVWKKQKGFDVLVIR
jgi:hypothetical protein